jgi:hypothetical protein
MHEAELQLSWLKPELCSRAQSTVHSCAGGGWVTLLLLAKQVASLVGYDAVVITCVLTSSAMELFKGCMCFADFKQQPQRARSLAAAAAAIA